MTITANESGWTRNRPRRPDREGAATSGGDEGRRAVELAVAAGIGLGTAFSLAFGIAGALVLTGVVGF